MARLGERLWGRVGRAGRVTTVLALGLLALPHAVAPLAGAHSPGVAVVLGGLRRESGAALDRLADGTIKGRFREQDPWGRPLVGTAPTAFGPFRFYSVGPDGVDQSGGGDDVVPTAGEVAVATRVDGASVGLRALGLLLLWCVHGPFVRAPRAVSLRTEVLLALVMASFPALAVPAIVAGLVLGRRDVTEYVTLLERHLPTLVPPVVAAVGTDLLLCTSFALAWRLSRCEESASGPAANGGGGAGCADGTAGSAPST